MHSSLQIEAEVRSLISDAEAALADAVYRHKDRDGEVVPQFTEDDLNTLLSPLG